MDLQAHLSFLANHPFSVVFWSSLIEAAGIPFPSRVILILTPAFLATERDLVWLIIVATIGALLGDHVPYTAGRVAGTRMLGLYCKVTLGSARCMERTLDYFRRFGAGALVLSRFSTSVRILPRHARDVGISPIYATWRSTPWVPSSTPLCGFSSAIGSVSEQWCSSLRTAVAGSFSDSSCSLPPRSLAIDYGAGSATAARERRV
jgi:membrane protein YqaA with SNARE-associated domain